MKVLGRVLFLGGAFAIGLFLWRSSPHEITLIYSLEARQPVRSLEVDISRGSESMRRAEFRFGDASPRQIEHRVRLPSGDYRFVFRIGRDDARSSVTLERRLQIGDGGTIVVPL